MKTLEQCQQRRPSAFNVNCKHISNFLLIIDFEQAKACWVNIEKINTFEDKISYIMRYAVVYIMRYAVFKCDQNLLKIAFEVIP